MRDKRFTLGEKSVRKVELDYIPTPAGAQLDAAIAKGARYILLVGGRRASKTYSALQAALKQIYVHQRRPNLGWIVARTYDMSVTLERMFRSFCTLPDGTSLIAREIKSQRTFLMWPPKSMPDAFYRVQFKSAEDPDRLRGSSLAWCVMDEACLMTSDTFPILQGCVLDSKGIIILCTTPRGKDWVYTDVYKRSLVEPHYVTVFAKTEENQYLPQDEVEQLKADFAAKSNALKRQELEGSFEDFSGAVFDQFHTDTHIIKQVDLPDSAELVCGIDWGYNDPFVCVFLWKHDGAWIVVDEFYQNKLLLRDAAAHLKNHKYWSRVKRIWCDPSRPDQRMEFMALGMKNIMPARRPDKMTKLSWPIARARLINNLFSKRVKSPFGNGEIPALTYFDNVYWGAKETQALCYEKTPEIDDKAHKIIVTDLKGEAVDGSATERLEGGFDHFVDALGYGIYSEVRTFGTIAPRIYDASKGESVPLQRTEAEINKERLLADLRAAHKMLDQPERKFGRIDPPFFPFKKR